MAEAHAATTGNTGAGTGVTRQGNVEIEMLQDAETAGVEFRAAMERQMAAARDAVARAAEPGGGKPLGEAVADRVIGLATEFQEDQHHVSKLLERATRTGDPMHLMRAMLALHDYQIRVQAMSKTVNKVAGAVDQLTKMQ
jgi:flagellar hook-basal body complex protein FliE